MTLLRRTTSPLLLSAAFTLVASVAVAQTEGAKCASDSDCAADATCVKDQSSPGCAVGPDGSTSDCNTEVHEAEFGICVTSPQACTSDADCGEYLGCVEENMGSCSGDSSGKVICEEVESKSYCGFQQKSCEIDSDCPREFECAEAEVGCITIACPDDEPDCGCSAEGAMECRPKSISCESDHECPSDWSCLGTMVYECSGGGEDGSVGSMGSGPTPGSDGDSGGETSEGVSAGGATSTEPAEPAELVPDPADLDGDVAEPPPADPGDSEKEEEPRIDLPEETCEPIPAVGSCYPKEWGSDGSLDLGSVDGSAIGGEGLGEEAPTKSAGNAESDDESSGDASGSEGGCSVSAVKPVSSGWLLSLFFVLPALRRRLTQFSLKH